MSFDRADLVPGRVRGWAGYVAGVVWALREAGIEVPGARLAVCTDVPLGAGLSSSAALECAVLATLLDLAGGPETTALGSVESGATPVERATVAEEPAAPAPSPANEVQCGEVTSAPHKDDLVDFTSDAPARRGHGGALPK